LKKLLKRLLVPILASRQVTAIAERLFDNGIPIFMLHRLAQEDNPVAGRINPGHLRQCLDYLTENNYNIVSLEHLILALQDKRTMPSKPIVFTMDDGYIDQAEIAAPIFLEYNCPLTFFVITGMLDQSIWPWDAQTSWIVESSNMSSLKSSTTIKSLGINFDESINKRTLRQSIQGALKKIDADVIPDILQQLSNDTGVIIPDTPPSSYRPMTWDMARQLEDQGIRFAPHSVNHNILSRLSQKTMEWEVKQSWQTIIHELKNPLKVFCYPNGRLVDFGSREIEVLKNTGYLGAMSTTPDFVTHNNNSGDQVYSLPRLALPDNMTDFIQYCSWIECIKDRV
jgi:peptidoglycan/xylan/chitin deacetylase (PgdA/CDA1 family)